MSLTCQENADIATLDNSGWIISNKKYNINDVTCTVVCLFSIKIQQYLDLSAITSLSEQSLYRFICKNLTHPSKPTTLYLNGFDSTISSSIDSGLDLNLQVLGDLNANEIFDPASFFSDFSNKYKFESYKELVFCLEEHKGRVNQEKNLTYQSELEQGVIQGEKIDDPEVCLIHLLNWFSDSRLSDDLFAPIGSSYIHAKLEDIGISVQTLLYRHDGSEQKIPAKIKNTSPKIIGISSTGHEIHELKTLSISLKNHFGNIPIVVGGYCSLDAVNLFSDSEIDIVVVGEGEQTVEELFPALLKRESLEQIRGIVYRSSGNNIRVNSNRKNIDFLDDLPTPTYQTYPPSSDVCVVTASRGCPYTCTYCEVKDFYTTKRIRHHSPGYIKAMLESFRPVEMQMDRVFFYDDEFLLYADHLAGIAPVLRELKLGISFQTRVRDIISHEWVINENKDIIRQIQLGVESFSQSQLDRWRKKTKVSHNHEALRILAKLDVPYTPLIILTDAYTTPEELADNCEGILAMPNSAWWFKGDDRIYTLISIKPYRRSLRFNRLLDFYGRAERLDQTSYLEAIWVFLKAIHKDFCQLSDIYLFESAQIDAQNECRPILDEIETMLDYRLKVLPEICNQAQGIEQPEKVIELGLSYAERYNNQINTRVFEWVVSNTRKIPDNYSSVLVNSS